MDPRFLRLLAVVAAAGTMLPAGCGDGASGRAPAIESREEFVLGESPGLRISGLEPGERYTVVAESTDAFSRRWRSGAVFVADSSGAIEPGRQAPVSGDYEGIDELGLLWSARMPEPPGSEWEAPEPRHFNEIALSLRREDGELARRDLRQWLRGRSSGGRWASFWRPRSSARPAAADVASR